MPFGVPSPGAAVLRRPLVKCLAPVLVAGTFPGHVLAGLRYFSILAAGAFPKEEVRGHGELSLPQRCLPFAYPCSLCSSLGSTECVRPRSYYRGAPGYLCGFIGKLICPVDITVAGAPSDFDGVAPSLRNWVILRWKLCAYRCTGCDFGSKIAPAAAGLSTKYTRLVISGYCVNIDACLLFFQQYAKPEIDINIHTKRSCKHLF